MVRLILILGLFLSLGCGRHIELDNDGPTARKECEQLCKIKYNADVSYVGEISGNCYCK